MEDPTAPRLSFSYIKAEAEKFLSIFNSDKKIPVPIEEIVEFNLKITIISVPNLKKVFDIDGFINSDFNQITIDDEVFNNSEERTRFTIAHEIGHKILHEKYFKHKRFCSIDDYISFQNSIPVEDYKQLERQANCFAGCLLVPGDQLKREVKKLIKERSNFLPALEMLPSLFKASPHVILIQLEREGIKISELL